MKLTTRGRYAVTAMLDLALHREGGPISLADISARQGISLSYLEQLFGRLRRADLVESSRGPGGGYQLGRGTDEISVAEVIDAVDESVDATRCGGQQNCQAEHQCLTHNLWQDLSGQIREFLAHISLDELARRPSVLDVSARQDHFLSGTRKNISIPVILDA
jgi:Rrf2 family iron-sulfur cluster assembly transcriptional regulator